MQDQQPEEPQHEQQPQQQPGEQQLTKNQRRQQRKEEERNQRLKQQQGKKVKKYVIIVLVFGVIGLGAWALISNSPSDYEAAEIISRRGIHWHPTIEIIINGEQQEVTGGIALRGSGNHGEMHTHDTSGVIHNEINRITTTRDTEVGKFFKAWGRDFNSECIFDFCNGPDGQVGMTVNSEPNFEFEKYEMKDGDQLVIRYE